MLVQHTYSAYRLRGDYEMCLTRWKKSGAFPGVTFLVSLALCVKTFPLRGAITLQLQAGSSPFICVTMSGYRFSEPTAPTPPPKPAQRRRRQFAGQGQTFNKIGKSCPVPHKLPAQQDRECVGGWMQLMIKFNLLALLWSIKLINCPFLFHSRFR